MTYASLISRDLAHANKINRAHFEKGIQNLNCTSISHPLRIDAIDLEHGTLGLTLCPGKKGEAVHGPPWDRDLTTDFDAIERWGADALVTLIEDREFRILQISDFATEVERRPLRWFHLPIRDLSIPDDAFERKWDHVGKELLRLLASGGRVVVHCRGGLGRAGLLAARILIDLGWKPDPAIQTVRKARPGAIETAAQSDYLNRRPARRIQASLLGGAMGDSLGAEIEFWNLDQIRARFPGGLNELPPHDGITGAITDDTQMTLFTAEGLLRAHVRQIGKGICHAPSVVHHALLRWLDTQGSPVGTNIDKEIGLVADARLRVRRAPGSTCLSALRSARHFGDLPHNDSKGCGTIMRVAPVAFAVERQYVRNLAIETSELTHGHVTGKLAAAAWAELLTDVRNGRDLEATARDLAVEIRSLPGGDETAAAMLSALEAPRNGSPETVETLGGGWIAEEALAIALYACLAAESLEDGLRCAVTHSGDSDSTGAIAGNMLGLLYPGETLTHRWAEQIECADLIEQIAEDLAAALEWTESNLNEGRIFERYPGW